MSHISTWYTISDGGDLAVVTIVAPKGVKLTLASICDNLNYYCKQQLNGEQNDKSTNSGELPGSDKPNEEPIGIPES